MKISGSGRISAGEYSDEVRISGSGKLDGNVKCLDFHCSGSAKATGELHAAEGISVSGSMHVEQSASAKNISVSGSAKFGGDCTAEEEIKISGSFKCGGSLKCKTLKSSGGISVEGDIEAEELIASGGISCAGLLNAEKIDIRLQTRTENRIGAIGGSLITVSAKDKSPSGRLPISSKLLGNSGGLTVNEGIEGEVIALEKVTAPKVIGRVVAIGAGCDIERVEYSEQIEIDPSAHVGSYEKVLIF